MEIYFFHLLSVVSAGEEGDKGILHIVSGAQSDLPPAPGTPFGVTGLNDAINNELSKFGESDS